MCSIQHEREWIVASIGRDPVGRDERSRQESSRPLRDLIPLVARAVALHDSAAVSRYLHRSSLLFAVDQATNREEERFPSESLISVPGKTVVHLLALDFQFPGGGEV